MRMCPSTTAGFALFAVTASILLVTQPWIDVHASVTSALQSVKSTLFDLLTVLLWDVYFHWYWGHQHEADICAQLTRVEAKFWEQNPTECTDRLQVQFRGFIVGIGTPILCYLLWQSFQTLMWYCFVFRAKHARRQNQESPRSTLLLRLLSRLTPRRAQPTQLSQLPPHGRPQTIQE